MPFANWLLICRRFGRRPRRRTKTAREIQQRILALKAAGHTAPEIAKKLNHEGRTTPHHKAFNAGLVRTVLSRCRMTQVRRALTNEGSVRAANEWFVSDLAREVGVSRQVVYTWIRTGRLPSRQVDGPQGRWIVHADSVLLEKLKSMKDTNCENAHV